MSKYCVNCKYFLITKQGIIWYDQFCKASERTKANDPITGKEGYQGKNDLGTHYVSDQKYDHARDVNKGSCVLFEEKQDEKTY